ncbi:hypothetical protein PGT21_032295 [Puccinia graminis f. sp. tritici]|uniref:Uncharacterized protein n=1 Tax=Puccinia graminis f. sp. tritici TaxID=56615 RepID=A0A5B0NDU2_PUCGR|nr:hypothetical protein PGT21_032295 [Puccinia graminis f. sp. tritici]
MATCPDLQFAKAHQDNWQKTDSKPEPESELRTATRWLVQGSESHSEETNMESLSARISNG